MTIRYALGFGSEWHVFGRLSGKTALVNPGMMWRSPRMARPAEPGVLPKVLRWSGVRAIRGSGRARPVPRCPVGRINVKGVIVGIALIQLYAAIRPRFGAGPATAVKAGIFTRRRGRSQVLQGALSRG